jgi:hypothetical protein
MTATSAGKPGYVAKMKANFRSPKWWLLVAVGIVASLVLRAVLSSSNTLGLELVAYNDTPHSLLQITNVSSPGIKLLDVSVNDGGSCAPFNFKNWKGQSMDVGMQWSFGTSCQILKATVQTDKGTASYSFR